MKERVLDCRLIVELPHRFKITLERDDQFLAKRNFVSINDSAVQQINDAQQKNRLVRAFMITTLVSTEIVQAL